MAAIGSLLQTAGRLDHIRITASTWPLKSALPVAALIILLVIGTPLFMASPIWVDTLFHDMCARNILQGGVHYKDIFETNLPGTEWIHVAIRSVLGWSPEAIRAVDLLIFAGIVGVLTAWLGILPVSVGNRLWLAVILIGCYFAQAEWCHCQRDIWMLFPALVGLWMRRRYVIAASREASSARRVVHALLEGCCWAVALWIKPMILVPALACWLISIPLALRASPNGRRVVFADFTGLLTGGLVIGAIGVVWLRESGSWPFFWEIMLYWNPEYQAYGCNPFFRRIAVWSWFVCGMPWSLVHFVALPISIKVILSSFWRRDRPAFPMKIESSLRLIVGFYLGWLIQAFLIQWPHEYVLVTPGFLALAVCAAYLNVHNPAPRLAWWTAAAFFMVAMVLHPMLQPGRLCLWPMCLTARNTLEVRDRLSLASEGRNETGRVNWEDLEQVEAFLRQQRVGHGEVTCFHSCTFPLYLRMGLRPSTRYLFWHLPIDVFRSHREEIRQELSLSPQRFVVADLVVPMQDSNVDWKSQQGGRVHSLPSGFPEHLRDVFPWYEPVVFRAGRYEVHRVTQPVKPFWFD